MEPEPRVYPPDQRPDVEVLVNGHWHQGELRSWSRGPDTWWANCSWRTGPGKGTHLGTFPQDQVREDTIDRSNGRDTSPGVPDPG